MLPIKSILLISNFLVVLGNSPFPSQPNKYPEARLSLNKRDSGNAVVCNLNPNLIAEIANYSNVASQIYKTVLSGSFKGKTYNDLAFFVDKFGSRLAGSQNLENSINFMMEKMKNDKMENVHGERLQIPHWVRGKEVAKMIKPREKNIALLGLGLTVGTLGIRAEVWVVKTLAEFRQNATNAKGKIILFNLLDHDSIWTPGFRKIAGAETANNGALACLFRSLTPVSIYSPHTGTASYDPNATKKIPLACITVEDSDLFQRFQDRGETIIMQLTMKDINLLPTTSRNAIGEIKGREKPDEVVIVSGHIDSWDVGSGAMDDGGGSFVSVETLAVLKSLNLRPRRTLRAILWTAEELGLYGVNAYIKRHRNELEKISVAFETDIGNFKPLGLDFSGSDEAGCIVKEVLKLLAPVNATAFRTFTKLDDNAELPIGTDTDNLIKEGVPAMGLNTQNDRYFWYHHTEGDTLSVQNSEDLDLCTAVWTIASYVLADLSVALPRD